jgi:serine/threonine protein kinase
MSHRDPYNLNGIILPIDKLVELTNVVFSSNFYIYGTTDCKKIVKVYEMNFWVDKMYVENEATFFEKASELEISPQFYGLCFMDICERSFGFLVMEKYGIGELTQLIHTPFYEKNKKNIMDSLWRILTVLNDSNICHGDLHSSNFLYSISDGIVNDVRIIDFECACYGKNKNLEIKIAHTYGETIEVIKTNVKKYKLKLMKN